MRPTAGSVRWPVVSEHADVETLARLPDGQGETLRRMEEADAYNAWLLERAEPYLGRRVLDIGAGIGTFSERLATRSERVVALERDPEFLPLLRHRLARFPNVDVLDTDATALDPSTLPTSLDTIVCFNVLEHIREDAEALRALHACLEPGGHLLLLVPAHPLLFGETDRMLEHERRYQKEPLRRLLRAAGFRIEELRHVNPLGALGWLISARVLRRRDIPAGPLRAFNKLVPVIRVLDAMRLPFGLSLWAVCRRP